MLLLAESELVQIVSNIGMIIVMVAAMYFIYKTST
jgi:hypothetical protein